MRNRLCAAAAAFLLAGTAFGQGGARDAGERAASLQAAFIRVANEVGPSVVGVYNIRKARVAGFVVRPGGHFDLDEFFRQFDSPIERRSIGSGVIIDPAGYILTNEHVVGNADAIEVMLPDGRRFEGRVAGTDARSDMAVLKIDAENLPAATLGDSDGVKTGQWAIAIGNPFGIVEENPMPTMTVGVVSALHRRLGGPAIGGRYYGDLIQTDAAINPGNSGGPLLNLNGEVVGINAAIISPSGAFAGIGFAIPVNRAKEVLQQLKEGKAIDYGWLGIGVQSLDRDLAAEFGVSDLLGALVVTIVPGSPAAAAGIAVGDVIRECTGVQVKDADALMEQIGTTRAGTTLRLKVLREGREVAIDATVGRKGEKVT
ncbi:MAG: trypsin-like peptidase domain-containing protein [Candidatus Aureabacteria bacterium]|nr:trypsin-like peptidase domain-containing protein [Candidatus Auribacterota bacterium]NLW93799.1 PDZ domain-containing protein [Chlamydiota bacterium]HOE26476.1 trypsin-like peptidase domain-containing protein [bacterium]HQM52757.1 trypsin-like peptidase domain-containing protein [bacterium]